MAHDDPAVEATATCDRVQGTSTISDRWCAHATFVCHDGSTCPRCKLRNTFSMMTCVFLMSELLTSMLPFHRWRLLLWCNFWKDVWSRSLMFPHHDPYYFLSNTFPCQEPTIDHIPHASVPQAQKQIFEST